MITPLTPDLGQWTLVQGFAAMTLGGFGSLGGAVAGGILLGITEKLLGLLRQHRCSSRSPATWCRSSC